MMIAAVTQTTGRGGSFRFGDLTIGALQVTTTRLGYKTRVADDRVGYFLTARQDWAKPTGARDLFDRYVNRWNLQKRDPSLKLCEPKQPIVFYIEKTVPVRFRRAVRDGARS